MVTKTDLRLELKNILLQHEGPEKAITGRELAVMFGFKSDRIIRLAIRALIRGEGDGNNGLPLVSTGQGYFIPTSRQQAEDYRQKEKGRLIEDALRIRDFRRAADQWLTPAEQSRLRL